MVKIHSSLVVVIEVFGSKLGGVRLDFRLGRISQEAPHSQGRATARPKFIVLGFPEQGFVLSLGFTAFATNECPFYNYNTPSLCVPIPICPSVASLTSHRERKVGTSLFSSFVWLCANDVEGKHCAQKEKKDREREGKKGGGKRKRKWGKSSQK